MGRSRREGKTGRDGDGLHAALRLAEQLQQLDAPRVRDNLADPRELLVEHVAL